MNLINKLVLAGTIPLHNKKILVSEADAILEEMKENHSMDAQRDANAKRRSKSKITLEDASGDYESIADMTDEERSEYDRQLSDERAALATAQEKAREAGADVGMEKMPSSLNKVKIFKELYQGKLAQLDFKKKSGELLEANDVKNDAFEMGRLIRDNLLNFPHKMSLRIAGVADPKIIEMTLEEEINNILEQMSYA